MRTRHVIGLLVIGLVALPLRTPLVRAAPENGDPVAGLHAWLDQPRGDRPALGSQAFAQTPLTRQQAEKARQLLWDDHVAMVKADRDKEWRGQAITIGEHTLRFLSRQFGNKPKNGWGLYISMHGGGNAPARVNDQQWQNQIKLYQPKDALYIAPRAPTDTWDLWHEARHRPVVRPPH